MKQLLKKTYVDTKNPEAVHELTNLISTLMMENGKEEVVFLCIGTDKITGDSLGPLVGHLLLPVNQGNVYIYGSLEHPVHANNLKEVAEHIEINHPHAWVVAIDACLGKEEKIGYIAIEEKPLEPGKGISKTLPQVGDVSLKAIVDTLHGDSGLSIQTTRLHLVFKMAEVIASSVEESLSRCS